MTHIFSGTVQVDGRMLCCTKTTENPWRIETTNKADRKLVPVFLVDAFRRLPYETNEIVSTEVHIIKQVRWPNKPPVSVRLE